MSKYAREEAEDAPLVLLDLLPELMGVIREWLPSAARVALRWTNKHLHALDAAFFLPRWLGTHDPATVEAHSGVFGRAIAEWEEGGFHHLLAPNGASVVSEIKERRGPLAMPFNGPSIDFIALMRLIQAQPLTRYLFLSFSYGWTARGGAFKAVVSYSAYDGWTAFIESSREGMTIRRNITKPSLAFLFDDDIYPDRETWIANCPTLDL